MNNLNKNILLGTAIGDALGVPVEFEHRQELEKNPVVGMREYGTHNQPKGTWSDDSSLALCLAESLCHWYYLFIWLRWVLAAAREIFIAAQRLTICGTWAPLL